MSITLKSEMPLWDPDGWEIQTDGKSIFFCSYHLYSEGLNEEWTPEVASKIAKAILETVENMK